MDKIEESAIFVARHYSPDAFSQKEAWRSLGIDAVVIRRFQPRRYFRYAAAAAVAVVLTASAALLIHFNTPDVAEAPAVVAPAGSRLVFKDTPLTEAIRQIDKAYGVKVTSIPAEDYRLTGVYEGTADDIVATINELLGINLKIEK